MILILCLSFMSVENHSIFVVEESMMNTLLVAVAEHGFRPPRRVSLVMISVEARVLDFFPTNISHQTCVPLWWSSPSVLNLVILQMLLDCANTQMQDHGCLCLGKVGRIHAKFFWNKCMCFEHQGSLQIYWNFMKNSNICAFHWGGSQWTHRILRFWGTESLRNHVLKNDGDGFLFHFYLNWA